MIFKNFAENERRKTLLSNAYGSELTDKKTVGYYNNNEKNSIKKLGVNDKFGKSGNPNKLYEMYGITVNDIIDNFKR